MSVIAYIYGCDCLEKQNLGQLWTKCQYQNKQTKLQMINLVRKIVAGPKNRTVDQEFDLDLTYITPKIIAMAFPASGLQKAYRNSIKDVARFLKLKHGEEHYLIINAANRKYDYEPFNNRVAQFFWTDHQAPPITTMFSLCGKVVSFLEESQQNVVAVHCNHGKGRTGTAIISYLLYSRQFGDVKEALKFYNNKRFKGDKYAVDQPCQLRYLNYFKSFLELPLSYLDQPLKAYKLTHVQQKGLTGEKELFVRISETRTEHVIYPSAFLAHSEIKFMRPLIGDVFIELLENTWTGTKQLLRINFNLFFLSKNSQTNKYQVIFMGDQIKMKHEMEEFQLILEFQEFCHCHLGKDKKKQCMCGVKREREQNYWDAMLQVIAKNRHRFEEHDGNKELTEDVQDVQTGEKQVIPQQEESPQCQQQQC